MFRTPVTKSTHPTDQFITWYCKRWILWYEFVNAMHIQYIDITNLIFFEKSQYSLIAFYPSQGLNFNFNFKIVSLTVKETIFI